MRVQWLSSAALLALIAAPGAFAQQVTSNEPFTIKLSGSSQAAMQFVQPSDSVKNKVVATKDDGTKVKDSLNAMQIVNQTRINVNGDAKVNGIGYGFGTTLAFANGTVNNDGKSNYVYVAPEGAGKISLGQLPYSVDAASFDGSMTWGTASFVSFSPAYGWGSNATGMSGKTAVMADVIDGSGIDNDSGPKIVYSSPDLAGLSASASFQPTNTNKGWDGNLSKNAAGTGFYNNIIQVGAGYTSPDMGGVSFGVAGDFMAGTAATIAGAKVYQDLSAYQGRVSATGYGFMAQFTYVGVGKTGQLSSITDKDGNTAFGSDGNPLVTNAKSGMSGSLAYGIGPAQVGAYFGMATLGDKSKSTAMGVGASYNVAKGAQVFAGYESFSNEPDSARAAKSAADFDENGGKNTVLKKQTAGAATVGMAVVF